MATLNFKLKKEIKISISGLKMYAGTLDRILALFLIKLHASEAFESKLFRSYLKKGMIVVDIGANLGYYTLIAAESVGNGGKVFAFEPDPDNFVLLKKNIETNGYNNVEPINLAVCDELKETKLFLCKEHRGEHRIYDSGDGRKAVTVQTTTVDEFFKDSPHIDVIKMDVQGAEALVFSGMHKIIESNPKLAVFIEFWPKGLRMAGFSPKVFLETIKTQGFKIFLINEDRNKLELIDEEKLLRLCIAQNYVNLFLKKISPMDSGI